MLVEWLYWWVFGLTLLGVGRDRDKGEGLVLTIIRLVGGVITIIAVTGAAITYNA